MNDDPSGARGRSAGSQEGTLDNELELILDGDRLAVIGDASAVEGFLSSEDLLRRAKQFDVSRLRPFLASAGDTFDAAARFNAESARWLKLTREAAAAVEQYGLMPTRTPGVAHAMIGKPGSVQRWLQVDMGRRSMLTSPAMLSGVAGLLQQVALQQQIAEVTAYLETIDKKVSEVLRKVDDTVLSGLDAAERQIGRARTLRQLEGRVSDDAWSTMQDAFGKLAGVQGYARRQLHTVAERLEHERRMRGLAQLAADSEHAVQKWLVVIATCFRLQDEYDVLQLDRALAGTPEELNATRVGLAADRSDRISQISTSTGHLLDRIHVAVARADEQMVWTWTRSFAVVGSGNEIAARVDRFHRHLGISAEARSWEPRQLAAPVEFAAKALQETKDNAPAMTLVGVLSGVAGLGLKVLRSSR